MATAFAPSTRVAKSSCRRGSERFCASRSGRGRLDWARFTPGGGNINVLTSEKLTDMGNAATFYSVCVEVELSAIPSSEGRIDCRARKLAIPSPWTVLALYRIITVFPTLVFRGSCDSSSSSGYPCVGPATRPRTWARREARLGLHLLPLQEFGGTGSSWNCLPRSIGASAPGCARCWPARPHRRNQSPRQPPHSRRHRQGPHLQQSGRRLRPAAIERDFNALWNTGYFEDIRFEREQSPKGWIVHIYLKERPTIREINYTGLSAVSTSDVLDRFKDRKVGLSVENQYDPTKIKKAEVVIEGTAGRARTSVRHDPHRNPPHPARRRRPSLSLSKKGPRSRSGKSASRATNTSMTARCARP